MNALATRPSLPPPFVQPQVAITKEDLATLGLNAKEGIVLPFGRPQPTELTVNLGAAGKVASIVQQSSVSATAATAVGLAGHAVYSTIAAGGPVLQNIGTLDVTNPLFLGAAVALGATTAYYGAKVAVGAFKTTRELAGQALLFEGSGNPELSAGRSLAVMASGVATQLLTTGATIATSVAFLFSQPAGYIAGGVAAAGAAIAGIATWLTGTKWAKTQRSNEITHEMRKALTTFENEVVEELKTQRGEPQQAPSV